MTQILAFRVAGIPITKGSKKLIPAILTKAGKLVPARMVDVNPHAVKKWQAEVVKAAAAAKGQNYRTELGPVAVVLRFCVTQPASEPAERRGWPIAQNKNDIDKLTRAVLDGLTQAEVFRDDAQVVELQAKKAYPGPSVGQMTPGVLIAVHRLAPEGVLPLV